MNKKDVTIGNAIAPFRDLNESHQRFVVAHASGKSLVDACQFAFPNFSRDNARKYGAKLMTRPDIIACVSELKAFKEKTIDISKQAMASRMMLLIGQIQSGPLTAKHYDVIVKILDMFNKMNGNYSASDAPAAQQNININIIPTSREKQQIDATDAEFSVEPEISEEEKQKLLAIKNIEDFLKSE